MKRIDEVIIPVLQKLAEDIAALNIDDDERPAVLNEVIAHLSGEIKLPNAKVEAAIADYVAGESGAKASAAHGIGEANLYYHLRRRGLTRSHKQAGQLVNVNPNSIPIDPVIAARVIDMAADAFDVTPGAILTPEDKRFPVARARAVAGLILRRRYKASNKDVMSALGLSSANWCGINKRTQAIPESKARFEAILAKLENIDQTQHQHTNFSPSIVLTGK